MHCPPPRYKSLLTRSRKKPQQVPLDKNSPLRNILNFRRSSPSNEMDSCHDKPYIKRIFLRAEACTAESSEFMINIWMGPFQDGQQGHMSIVACTVWMASMLDIQMRNHAGQVRFGRIGTLLFEHNLRIKMSWAMKRDSALGHSERKRRSNKGSILTENRSFVS
jgi:hypothetical protein